MVVVIALSSFLRCASVCTVLLSAVYCYGFSIIRNVISATAETLQVLAECVIVTCFQVVLVRFRVCIKTTMNEANVNCCNSYICVLIVFVFRCLCC